jgi:hypothetical protein
MFLQQFWNCWFYCFLVVFVTTVADLWYTSINTFLGWRKIPEQIRAASGSNRMEYKVHLPNLEFPYNLTKTTNKSSDDWINLCAFIFILQNLGLPPPFSHLSCVFVVNFINRNVFLVIFIVLRLHIALCQCINISTTWTLYSINSCVMFFGTLTLYRRSADRFI